MFDPDISNTMKSHYTLTDDEFETAFSDGTLDAELFTHEAHVRLAWIQIRKYGLEAAIHTIHKQLSEFVELVGAKDKFHLTLTVVSVQMVAHFINKSTATTFQEFITEFPELISNFKGLIASHYKSDIFNSERAKIEYIAPDIEFK